MHKSVLLKESIDGLDIQTGDVFFDATVGAGGHSEEVARRFGNDVRIVGTDADKEAIERASARVRKTGVVPTYVVGNYRIAKDLLRGAGIMSVNRSLFDAGFSSDQLDSSGRGFSFLKDEPLLMTFESEPTEESMTARDIVNSWDEKNIATILFSYGEERFARRIAKGIVEAREKKPIETTFELVQVIVDSVPKVYAKGRIHPATRTFQALRITVNNELTGIEEGLRGIMEITKPGGRIAFISFHSLEDRIVKRLFREFAQDEKGILITKKPLVPDNNEINENPRSRSAKLRIIQKI